QSRAPGAPRDLAAGLTRLASAVRSHRLEGLELVLDELRDLALPLGIRMDAVAAPVVVPLEEAAHVDDPEVGPTAGRGVDLVVDVVGLLRDECVGLHGEPEHRD